MHGLHFNRNQVLQCPPVWSAWTPGYICGFSHASETSFLKTSNFSSCLRWKCCKESANACVTWAFAMSPTSFNSSTTSHHHIAEMWNVEWSRLHCKCLSKCYVLAQALCSAMALLQALLPVSTTTDGAGVWRCENANQANFPGKNSLCDVCAFLLHWCKCECLCDVTKPSVLHSRQRPEYVSDQCNWRRVFVKKSFTWIRALSQKDTNRNSQW